MHAPTQVHINLLHSINTGETLAALETDICIHESGSCATLQRRFWSILQMRAVGRLVLNPAEQRVAHRRLWETPAKAVAEDPRRNSIKNSVVIILCAASAHRKRESARKWRLFVRRSVSKIKKSVRAILFARGGFRQTGRKLPDAAREKEGEKLGAQVVGGGY